MLESAADSASPTRTLEVSRPAEAGADDSFHSRLPPKRRADPAVEAMREFIDFLLPPPRDFTVRLWEGTEFGGEEGSRYTIVLSEAGTARRMFGLPVELALGEAFIFGDFDIEGDFEASFGLKDRARAALTSPAKVIQMLRLRSKLPRADGAREGRGMARLSGRLHSRRRDRAAIQYHYDVGNEFFALWLDERMIYTCAYFPTATGDLALAQELKLRHICGKLRLKAGERVLDIGCGWGGFCIYAALNYGVRVVGVTLSQRQYEFASNRVAELGLSDMVEIRLQDYRDVPETFDKIVSIGMFEAVGPNYAEYFSHVYRMMKPAGLFLNHSIAANARADAWIRPPPLERALRRAILGTGLVRERYIFPDGALIPVSEANLIAEKEGFEVRDVENLREHYELTLREWLSRLDARKEEAVRLAGETVYRTWRLYMTAAAIEFRKAMINVNQTLFARPLEGVGSLPLTRADLYPSSSTPDPTVLHEGGP